MGYYGIVHVLPEQWLVIKSIEGDAVWSDRISSAVLRRLVQTLAFTISASPIETFWVLFRQCAEQATDMFLQF